MIITTKVINSKRHESIVVANLAGMGENTIKLTGEWQSESCPEGVKAM